MTSNFEETKTRHRALVQFHRWYQLYERPMNPERIAKQLEILDQDVTISTTRGDVKGHDGYRHGIATLNPADLNSHRVRSATVTRLESGKIGLSAEIIYQRLEPNGTLTSAELHYEGKLRDEPGALPIFEELDVALKSLVSAPAFVDAYPGNRVGSFIHAWLWRMEELGSSPEGFRELLATDGFELHFSTGSAPITTYEQLADWFAGTGARVAKSSHRESGLTIDASREGEYTVGVDFDWAGVDKTGQALAGRTHHDWVLKDGGERFCRIKQARVTVLRPLGPA
jgi:hypothetical protein